MILRHVVLVFVLVMLMINSQFEWNQKFSIVEANPTRSRRKQQILDKEDAIKERGMRTNPKLWLFHQIIFSQEKIYNNLMSSSRAFGDNCCIVTVATIAALSR